MRIKIENMSGKNSLWKKLEYIIMPVCFFFTFFLYVHSIQGINVAAQTIIYINRCLIVSSLFLSLFIVLLAKECDNNTIIFFFFCLGLLFLLFETRYYPLDEYYHNAYISTIIQENRLPFTQENYEAFQPPLYYLLMAGMTFFIRNELIRFYVTKLTNLVILVLSYYFILKIIQYLADKKIIKQDGWQNKLIVTLITFAPASLYRATSVNNEILSMLFITIAVYYLIKLVLEDNVISAKNWVLASVLILAAILTKLTNLYMLLPLIAILVYRRKFKEIIYSSLILIIGMLPWLIYNVIYNGKLLLVSQHIEVVSPIANYYELEYSFAYSLKLFLNIFRTSILPQEVYLYMLPSKKSWLVFDILSLILLLLLLFAIIRFLVFAVQFIMKKLSFDYSTDEKRKIIEMIASVMLLGITGGLLMVTYFTSIDYMVSRYLVSANVAMVLLAVLYLDKIKKIFAFAIESIFVLCSSFSLLYTISVIYIKRPVY